MKGFLTINVFQGFTDIFLDSGENLINVCELESGHSLKVPVSDIETIQIEMEKARLKQAVEKENWLTVCASAQELAKKRR